MGGEGVECNGEILVRGGNLECTTFDDGIDSNGIITIAGGIVASVNQTKPNESFDAENGEIVFKGGTVFGMAMHNNNKALRAYITVMSPSFHEYDPLILCEGDIPVNASQTFFHGELLLKGDPAFPQPITVIPPQTIK